MTRSMIELNRDGAEAAVAAGVTSMTDVTGFGLLGHLMEMCDGAGLSAELWFDALPWLPGAVELARRGVVPGGTRRNLEYVDAHVGWLGGFEEYERLLAADTQTSGGMLIAVNEERVDGLIADLEARGTLAAATVGRMVARTEPSILVRRTPGSDR